MTLDLNYSNGPTYVAFSDLCGFKKMMQNRDRAYHALDCLFSTTYSLLDGNDNISGIAVSDCVVSWSINRSLDNILDFVKDVHREMVQSRCLIRTSISYGEFYFQDRIQLRNLQKSMLMGGAYLDVFLTHEDVLPGSIIYLSNENDQPPTVRPDYWRLSKKPKGYEYFWTAGNNEDIQHIIETRNRADDAKYEWLKDLYQYGWNGMPNFQNNQTL